MLYEHGKDGHRDLLEEEIGPVPVTVQKTQTAVDLADYSPD
jgi:hypothetical protein